MKLVEEKHICAGRIILFEPAIQTL